MFVGKMRFLTIGRLLKYVKRNVRVLIITKGSKLEPAAVICALHRPVNVTLRGNRAIIAAAYFDRTME